MSLRSPNRQPRWRAARRQAMKAAGTVPCRRQWAWNVQPDGLHGVPEWAQQVAVHGLGKIPGRVWLWRVDAKRLMGQVRRAGWRCEATRAEVRHCCVCERPLVGIAAERRRLLDESGPDGRLQPCGGDCLRDAAAGMWRKLNPYARTAGTRARAFERQT